MKRIYFLIICLLFYYDTSAQCIAWMDLFSEGNIVTATINGSGATEPIYTIDWGDFSPLEDTQVGVHTYEFEGQYTICFVYADQLNLIACNQSACQDVIITGTGCTMDFETYTLGLTTTVIVNAGGAGVPTYDIDWGDGSPHSNEDQATHIYEVEGIHTICVTFTDQDNLENCTLYQCHDVSLTEQSGSCEVALSLVVDGEMVSATAIGSGSSNESYIISWGDDSFDNSSIGYHIYEANGTYEICAVYGDANPDGCSASDCESVLIELGGGGNCSLTVNAIPVGLNVGLTAVGIGATNPEYTIDWGDNSPTESVVPATHLYGNADTYQICVSYIDLDNIENCQVVECQEIEVSDGTTDCTVDITVEVVGNVVNVSAVGTGAANPQYLINWGGGFSPTIGSSGSNTYSVSDSYSICVTYVDVDDFAGCNAQDCENVDITIGIKESLIGDNSLRMIPNPLADNSALQFSLSKPALVQIDVLDLLGNRVDVIQNGQRGQGIQKINWNAASLAGGIYFIRVRADNEERTIKVIR